MKNRNLSIKIIPIIFTSILFINALFAQNNITDSLARLVAQSHDETHKSDLLLSLSIAHYKTGNYSEAKKQLNACVLISKKNKLTKNLIKATNNLGNIAADQGNNKEALIYYQEALNNAEQIHDELYAANISKNIGALFVSQKQFTESLQFYNKAQKKANELSDTLLMADCSNNIGTVLEQLLKYEDAKNHYLYALDLYTKLKVSDGIAMCYSNLAIVSKLLKNYNEAIEYNKKSLVLSEAIDDKWAMAATYNNIGNIYGEQGNFEFAQQYSDKALKLANEINAPEIILNVYENLANAANKAGNYKSAIELYKIYVNKKDSFINITNNKQLSELNIKYETEKLQHEAETAKLNADKAATHRNIILAAAILALLISLLVYRFYMIQQKQKLNIETQTQINETIVLSENAERSRIAKDLHDGVGQKLSVVKMQLSLKNKENILNLNSTIDLLDNAINEVRTVSHELIPTNLQHGIVAAINTLCDEINFSKLNLKAHFTTSKNIDTLKIHAARDLILYRVVQEIINNTLKYAQAKNIFINLDSINNKIELTVSDDGSGFDIDTAKLKDGIGINNIFDRIEKLKGTVNLKSSINKGTEYFITLNI